MDEEAAIRKFRIAAAADTTYAIQHDKLDAIISVGYGVNSVRATQLRQWATSVLFADAGQPNMGLTQWEKAPDGKVLRTDVAVAKNYLSREELESLGRIVNAYLDLAEELARRPTCPRKPDAQRCR